MLQNQDNGILMADLYWLHQTGGKECGRKILPKGGFNTMTPKCERCGASGPMKETPCRTCRGGHDLCGQCRETFERF